MRYFLFLSFAVFVCADVTIRQNEFTIKKPIVSWIEVRNQNLVRQNFDYSCGSAALSTILSHYYDMNITEEDILSDALKAKGVNQDLNALEGQGNGLSFYDLSEFVKVKNFKAIGMALGFEELKKLKIPVIVFVKIRKQEHFSALKKIDENYVYLADPSFGNIRINHTKFKEMFFQREDDKIPGKILAILPADNSVKIKADFMDTQPFGEIIYEILKRPLKK